MLNTQYPELWLTHLKIAIGYLTVLIVNQETIDLSLIQICSLLPDTCYIS